MFVGRDHELQALRNEFTQWSRKSAVLIYGKRRVGKSSLVNEAANSFNGIVINHLCVNSTFDGNLELLGQSVTEALSLPHISFHSLFSLFDYLKTVPKKILLILDEYPYLKQTKKRGEVDSILQAIIDRLPGNIKLVLCGSYITIMKELLEESNPLFGRFSLIMHVRDFDYYDSSRFYSELSPRNKIAFYAIFGGSPYVLSQLNSFDSLKHNICRLLLPETSVVRIHIENIMLKEIQKSFDARILEAIGNGKKKYSEIRDWMKSPETGLLDKQLKILLDMETIQKTEPINRRNDKKKQFYEIVDNLMRFYFTYIFGKAGIVARIGPDQFYNRYIEGTINQYISRRLEGIAIQYFHRAVLSGQYDDIEDYGTYWYDDPATKTNGEFDCVIRRTGDKYDFYECKYFDRKMSIQECKAEEIQLNAIKGIDVAGIGFICSEGFSFESNDYKLIGGKDLYEHRQ